MKLPKVLITTITLLATTFSVANNMQSSFNDAMNVGKSQSGKGGEAMTSFDPSSVMTNYTSNPSEVNLRGNTSGLSSLGMQDLNSSEVGKAINDSTVNNPKVKISEDADFLKVSDDIRKNASVISGMKSGKQCVNQVLSKTSYTNHYCEKDQVVNHICMKEANVVWSGAKKIEKKEYDFTINTPRLWYEWRNKYGNQNVMKEKIRIPEAGYIRGYSITIPYQGGGYYIDFNRNTINLNFANKDVQLKMRGDRSLFGENTLFESFKVNKDEDVILSGSNRGFGGFGRNDLSLRGKNIKVKVYMEIEVDDIKPEIVWVDSCSNTNVEDSIKISEQCTQAGGSRNFVKNGKNYTLNAECWRYEEKYLVGEASDNECKSYENNSNCSVTERECILSQDGKCLRFRNKYQCSKVTKTDGYLCGDEFFCSDGSCSDLEGSVNTDFGHAVSQLANLAKASEDYDYDAQNFRAFSGRAMFCRKSGFGYSDCCKDSGWGQSAGLAKCNSEEQMLGQAKEKKTAVFVGTFCSRRVLKKCVQRKSGYCVFDNKLARITQVQGRSGQLGLGFGGASSPNCRGLTVEELQGIDFNAMDYSDFYDELNSNTEVPNKDQLIEYMKNSITEQMKQ